MYSISCGASTLRRRKRWYVKKWAHHLHQVSVHSISVVIDDVGILARLDWHLLDAKHVGGYGVKNQGHWTCQIGCVYHCGSVDIVRNQRRLLSISDPPLYIYIYIYICLKITNTEKPGQSCSWLVAPRTPPVFLHFLTSAVECRLLFCIFWFLQMFLGLGFFWVRVQIILHLTLASQLDLAEHVFGVWVFFGFGCR